MTRDALIPFGSQKASIVQQGKENKAAGELIVQNSSWRKSISIDKDPQEQDNARIKIKIDDGGTNGPTCQLRKQWNKQRRNSLNGWSIKSGLQLS